MAKKKPGKRGRPPKPKKASVCSICSGKITPTNILTRPMLVRFSKLHDLFREQREDSNPLRRFLSYNELAAYLQCGKSTVRRDIALLRDQYKLPIDEFPERDGWGYTEDVAQLPNVLITEGDLLALCASWGAMAARRGRPLDLQGRPALEKLMAAYGYKLPFDLQTISERVVFRSSGYQDQISVETFETVVWALMNQHELEFTYRKQSEDGTLPEPEHRRVQPRCLLCLDHVYYLIADDPTRDDGIIRKFALYRMTDAEDTEVAFKPSKPLNLEESLRHSLGVHTGGDVHTIELLFHPSAAGYAREYRWHETEQFSIAPDKRLRLTFTAAINPELEARIWRWGSKVEVVHPPDLRKQFAADVVTLASVYHK